MLMMKVEGRGGAETHVEGREELGGLTEWESVVTELVVGTVLVLVEVELVLVGVELVLVGIALVLVVIELVAVGTGSSCCGLWRFLT